MLDQTQQELNGKYFQYNRPCGLDRESTLTLTTFLDKKSSLTLVKTKYCWKKLHNNYFLIVTTKTLSNHMNRREQEKIVGRRFIYLQMGTIFKIRAAMRSSADQALSYGFNFGGC